MSCDQIISVDLSSTIMLNDGVVMPMFGLGTALLSSSEAVEAASFALQNGYRLLDTAAYYQYIFCMFSVFSLLQWLEVEVRHWSLIYHIKLP